MDNMHTTKVVGSMHYLTPNLNVHVLIATSLVLLATSLVDVCLYSKIQPNPPQSASARRHVRITSTSPSHPPRTALA